MDIGNHQALKLQERIKELEETNTQLETELVEALQDPFTKYERKTPSENPKKRGAPFGHEGHFRPNPEHIDKEIEVYLDVYPECGSENISPCHHTTRHIQEDLDQAKFSFLRHEIKVSYDDAQRALSYLCNVNVASGAIVGFDNKIAEKAAPFYEKLKQSLQGTPFIHVDETGWKRDWLWIFTNPEIVFFHIDESRGSKVVIDHLGEFYKGILITDFRSAYRNKIGAFAKQKYCTHPLRDIKKLLDKGLPEYPEAEVFLKTLKKLIQDAIFLHNAHLALSGTEYRSACKEIRKRFKKSRSHVPLSHHETNNIRKRLITFKDELFVFLKYPVISPTNNPAEQGIRNAVLFRKITFGNMTRRGKNNVAVLMPIIRTAKLRSLNPVVSIRRGHVY